MRIIIVLLSMVLASCSTLQSNDSSIELIEANQAAIEAVKAIDSYYLTPCKKPEKATSDYIDHILDYIDQLIVDYSDCYKRHNGLIPQVR